MIFSPQYIEDIHTPEIEQLTKRTKVDHLQTVCRELCLGFDLSHKTVWPLKPFVFSFKIRESNLQQVLHSKTHL